MRNFLILIAGLFVLALAFACQPKKQADLTDKPVTLAARTIQQNKGADCDKQPDTLRMDCAIFDITVPTIEGAGAQSALGKNINAWVDKFLIHLLIYSDYPETDPSKAQTTVDAAIKRFHAMHDDSKGSLAGGQFKVMCTNSALLNDGKYLTLMLDGYSFQGGNHHLEDVAIASFDVKTGQQLTWADLVNDQKALLPIAQAKVQEARVDAFKEGFSFDKEEPFALPNAYGFTSDGLLMHYSPDEIYQLGGSTEFTILYNELGTNLKAATPIAPATEASSSTEAADFFEAEGDSLVIPPFEVEVLESSKATADMKKRKETIIVSAYFWGEPRDPKEKAKGEDGEITVLNKDIELTGSSRIAHFEGLKFHKNLLKQMEGGDISLLINVFSGRKSTQDNLLSCGLVDAKASNFRYHRFLVGCSLIMEDPAGNMPMTVAFSLPDDGSKPAGALPLVVDCNERGEISLAGTPMKDMDELKASLKSTVSYLLKNGYKNMPEIKTQGCLMGMQGAIRDTYEEVKNELQPSGKKPTEETNKTAESTNPATKKSETKPTPGAGKVPTKPAPPTSPTVTLNEKGEITVDGAKVTLDGLRKAMQTALLSYAAIPNEVPLKTIGQTGMGMRAEVNTEVNAAISGAKWIRKKAALEAMSNSVGKKLGTAVDLEVSNYQTSGSFAFVDARPKTTDGKAIDYSTTSYKEEFAKGKFADRALGLLQFANGKWSVLAYNIGTNAVPVDAWVKTYKAPKGLFAKK